MMRRIWLVAVMALAGCGQAPQDGGTEPPASPDIRATAIPGIALTYRYGFRVPIGQLSSLQEEHAARCEALTPARCRIAGMTYDVRRDRRIDASLDMRLAPDMARRFGKEGVDAAVRKGGMLMTASIDTKDAGAIGAQVDKAAGTIAAERAEINRQLANPGLSGTERAALRQRLGTLADDDRAAVQARTEAAQLLASTPVTFTYASGEVQTGLTDSPILGAMKDGWANVVSGSATIVMLLITLTPWVAVALFLAWLWRRAAWRFRRDRDDA